MTGLKVFFCGYGGNSWMAEELRSLIEELGLTLVTIHEHENADIKWERSTWLNHLSKADIIIAPANYKVQPAKSANRLTQAMSLGKPVICAPLPAYLEVAKKYPGSFLLADTPEEWKERLRLLKNTLVFRQQLGERAKTVAKDYSIDVIGSKWISVIQDREIVDIVIPTYKNLRGLELCLDSIRTCTSILYNIIIVNNGNDEKLHKYLEKQKDIIYVKKEKLNFAQAVNIGIQAGNSKYVMILNDDVIVSKGWLQNMVEACTQNIGAVGLLSNCDKTWLHNYDINIGGVDLLPGTNTFEKIKPIIPQIYNFKSPHTETIEREWVAFYATLIPREVIQKVGILDESFINSGEDTDYCHRIRKQGYKIIQTYKSFVFHFGAVSRKILEGEDYKNYHDADTKTITYLNLKYSKPTVVVYSGPSWERWDFCNLEKGGIGGSEVWQIMICEELSNLGFRVVSFCDSPQQEIWNGSVKWLHYSQYPSWCNQNWVDYAILSRTTDPLKLSLRAGKVFVMVHDVFLLSNRYQLFIDKVDKFCVLSKWHWDFFKDYHGITDDNKLSLTANGIDFNRFDNIKVERNPYRLHWSSSWDRGLDNLLYLFPFIKKEFPKTELHIFYGCHGWKESCKQKGDSEGLKRITKMEETIQQPGIFNHGRVNQKDLANELKKATLLLYPGWFSETFFIGGIEAQRAGVPVIANKYAGLITSLGDSAILLGNGDAWWPYSKEGREAFLDETLSILEDKNKWTNWSERGFQNTKKYSWKNVALMWQKLFKGQ